MRPDLPTALDSHYESVKLPNLADHPRFGKFLPPGVYDHRGRKLSELKDPRKYVEGAVFVEYAGVNFVWGVFRQPLSARQLATMHFENVPGSAPITAMFGQWDRKLGAPVLGDAVFPLVSVQRGLMTARIAGQNDFAGELPAAAGFILSPTAQMPS